MNSRDAFVSIFRGRRIFVLSAMVSLALMGVVGGGIALAVCTTQAYTVTSSAPPPIGFWTDTSGAVWSPAGGFPGCASGDTAADTNGSPTTLIINSAIPNPINGLTISSPGGTIDLQSGASLTLAGTGTMSSSSTIIVEPGSTFTVANGGALTFNSGTSLSVNGGYTDIQTGGQLNILGASTVTNNGTLNVAGGVAVNNLFTVQSTGHVTFNGATVTGTNRINNLGTVTSTGNTTYSARLTGTPTVQVNGGTLTVSGEIDSPIDVNTGSKLSVTGSVVAAVNVKSGATLGGTGTISGAVTVTGGTVSPGLSPGILHTGNLGLDSASTIGVELNGTTAGTQYDQVDVAGTVSLGNSALSLTLGYTPALGDSFTIVNNDSNEPVNGIFAGLTQGATFCAGGAQFQISYSGGSNNNDVVLTVVGAPGVATHFSVSAPANAVAGTPINVTVTALDACGNVATGYAGTVHFTSSDPQAVLPANTALSSGTGTFPTTLKTVGTQTITATDTVSSGINGTSNDIDVAAGPATHFAVTAPSNAIAGTPFNFTVTALDAGNNTATGYAGMVQFTSSDPQAVLPANAALSSGTGTFPATLKTAGTQTTTATDTVSSGINGTSNDINVAPGAATHFAVNAPSNAVAGTPFNFTVTALDASNNVATGFAGTAHFTSSDAQAVLPANAGLSSGTGTFPATLKTVGSQTITATDSVASGINGTSNNIDVAAGAATHFTVTAPSNASAGMAFNFTVTAFDASNNVAAGYAGAVHFTSSDPQAVLPVNATLGGGTGTFSATLKTVGSQTISGTDTVASGITGTSNAINVATGTATHFQVTAPASASGGIPFNFTVTARDSSNNVVTGYAGTLHFTSSDPLAALPPNATLSGGSGTFSATLRTAGAQTITATDPVSSGITGTSNAINVSAEPVPTLSAMLLAVLAAILTLTAVSRLR
ncbi:MAG: hypothetical protein JOZ54_02205 [Acidobacteria bacterium]|nr:hypothetical protein [Acidobacteriota bacterium]